MTPEQLEAHRVRFEQRFYADFGFEPLRLSSGYVEQVALSAWTAYQWALADADRAQRAAPVSESVAVAWGVYWGLGATRKHSVHFEKATADEVVSSIKSCQTEVRPLYATVQPVAREPLSDKEIEGLLKLNHFSEKYKLKKSDNTVVVWYRLGLRDGERAHSIGIKPTSAEGGE